MFTCIIILKKIFILKHYTKYINNNIENELII